MDLIGPLPRSTQGHEYILMMVSYATRYPKAIPLHEVMSRNIIRELMLHFSQVGILKDLLTYQGTPFISMLMADLHWLQQVKHLKLLVFHLQNNGLVE